MRHRPTRRQLARCPAPAGSTSPVELGRPLTRQYAGSVGPHDEQLGGGAVDEPRPDVDERAEHLGHPAASRCACRQRLGVGAGQARADDPGAEHDRAPATAAAGRVIDSGLAGTAEHGARRLGEAHPQQRRGEERRRRRGPASGRPGGGRRRAAATNTNSTAPGTSASPRAWARKANVSPSSTTNAVPIVASSDHPPTYSTGRDGGLELVADEAEVGPGDVPRLASSGRSRRTSSGSRARRPSTPSATHGERDGEQRRAPRSRRSSERQAVADEHDRRATSPTNCQSPKTRAKPRAATNE